jgi:hypothetical protein
VSTLEVQNSQLKRAATDATTHAERVSVLEEQNTQLRKAATDASAYAEKVSSLEAQNAQLQELNTQLKRVAMDATLYAEKQHLDRVATGASLSNQSIAEPQAHEMEAAVKDFPGMPVDIFAGGSPAALQRLGAKINDILTAGGWNALSWTWSGAGDAQDVTIMIKPLADAKTAKAAAALTRALNATGIPARLQIWPGEWNKFGGMVNNALPANNRNASRSFASNRSAIRVVVGGKP